MMNAQFIMFNFHFCHPERMRRNLSDKGLNFLNDIYLISTSKIKIVRILTSIVKTLTKNIKN